jgi:aerobic carbon-monoxide dehydrogenase small subunit
MRQFDVRINGTAVSAEAEPRTQLADFLRGQLYLTGTHIGCEHGVCGACTVLIDGAPARSCITYAVACEGAEVTTIEGLREDAVMADLREAFSKNHALQCGYCTPGMLISARDIVLRLPEADEARIRLELSGNLCRCTGYVGIIAAVKEVLQKRQGARPVSRSGLGPVGAHMPAKPQSERAVRRTAASAATATTPEAPGAEQWRAVEAEGVVLTETFRVPFARERVWKFFDDLDRVARCMPGAHLTGPPVDNRAEGEVNVKLGPIASIFGGVIEVARDDASFSGIVRGAGRDAKSGSNARAIIGYRVLSQGDAASQVDISVKFLLTGALAQFSRSGLVKDVAGHLTAVFATNLEAALSGRTASDIPATTLDVGSVTRAALWQRIRGIFARMIGK